jgi:hypothetical protein
VDVLDDYVLGTVGDAEAFAADDACVADADEGLVGSDVDVTNAGFVVGDLD